MKDGPEQPGRGGTKWRRGEARRCRPGRMVAGSAEGKKERGCAVGMRIRNQQASSVVLVTSMRRAEKQQQRVKSPTQQGWPALTRSQGKVCLGLASGKAQRRKEPVGEGWHLLPPSWLEGRRRALGSPSWRSLRHGREEASQQRKTPHLARPLPYDRSTTMTTTKTTTTWTTWTQTD